MKRNYIRTKAFNGTATQIEMILWINGNGMKGLKDRFPTYNKTFISLLAAGEQGYRLIALAVDCLTNLEPKRSKRRGFSPTEQLKFEVTLEAIRMAAAA
jgi:hypothetical protein